MNRSRPPRSATNPPWWLRRNPVTAESARDLDELDGTERTLRQQRLGEWQQARKHDIGRAKRVLADAASTPEEKQQAKILIGTYAVDPLLMFASGSGLTDHGSQGMTSPANRHPETPLPPTAKRGLLHKLRRWTRPHRTG